jgi:hypothetical protein
VKAPAAAVPTSAAVNKSRAIKTNKDFFIFSPFLDNKILFANHILLKNFFFSITPMG